MFSLNKQLDVVWSLLRKLLASSFGAGFNLSFLSAEISCIVFTNTLLASIPKLTDVLDSKDCY